MRQRKILIWAGLLLSLIISGPASAALIFTSLGGDKYSVSFDPLTFTATGSSVLEVFGVVFEDFFTADNTAIGSFVSLGSSPLTITGESTTHHMDSLAETGVYNVIAGLIDPNDLLVWGRITPPDLNFAVGNSVTIAISDLVFSAAGVPAARTSGSVDAYLITTAGRQRSAAVATQISSSAVPLPGTALLLVSGLAGLGAARSKDRTRRRDRDDMAARQEG